MTIDEGRAAFEQLILRREDYALSNLSESDTRSKIIDVAIKDVLGWTEDDILREGYSQRGFYDYRVNCAGFSFLVEAKRDYQDLDLPEHSDRVSLKTLLGGNREVIEQMRSYCLASDLAHGIITNGRQFIIGQFVNSNGNDWKSNKAIVYSSHQAVLERFVEFYDNLSRDSVIKEGGIKYALSSDRGLSYNLLRTSPRANAHISRNTISEGLALSIDRVFGEIFADGDDSDAKFAQACFVENIEAKKNRNEIEKLFEDSAPNYAEVVPAKNFNNITNQIADNLDDGFRTRLSTTPPKPIILIGTKGAGKTSFMNYLWKYKMPDETKDKHPYVYIDFRLHQVLDGFNTERICSDILSQLYDRYANLKLHTPDVLRRVYYKEIKYREEGVWSKKMQDASAYEDVLLGYYEDKQSRSQEHLVHLSRYLAYERGLRLVVLIDNCDQLDEEVQKQVYMFAQAVSKAGKCGVMLALREGFYHRFRETPAINAYEDHVYHISAPGYREIIQKRIQYALSLLVEEEKSITGYTDGGSKISINRQHIIEFLESVENTILKKESNEIVEYINETTYPDIREGLRIFRAYLTSGYTNVGEIIFRRAKSMATGDTGPNTRLFEFIRAVALGNRLHYKAEGSLVKNVLYPHGGSRDYFIRLRVMVMLAKNLGDHGWAKVYLEWGVLKEAFYDMGYRKDKMDAALQDLFAMGMVDSEYVLSDTDSTRGIADEERVSLTRRGYYYLHSLIGHFMYLDLVVMDTPIYERHAFETINKVFPEADEQGKRVLDRRIGAVEAFYAYLKQAEKQEAPTILARTAKICEDYIEPTLFKDIATLWQRLK